jgi:hypothetical protein
MRMPSNLSYSKHDTTTSHSVLGPYRTLTSPSGREHLSGVRFSQLSCRSLFRRRFGRRSLRLYHVRDELVQRCHVSTSRRNNDVTVSTLPAEAPLEGEVLRVGDVTRVRDLPCRLDLHL